MITQEQLEQLLKAINENGEYNLENDEYSIKAKSSDNSVSVEIVYNGNKKLIEEQKAKFEDYLNSIDDDIFERACERFNVAEMQKYLDSNDLDKVVHTIAFVKNVIKEVILEKIEYYKECLKK